jgi:hypothetical protein
MIITLSTLFIIHVDSITLATGPLAYQLRAKLPESVTAHLGDHCLLDLHIVALGFDKSKISLALNRASELMLKVVRAEGVVISSLISLPPILTTHMRDNNPDVCFELKFPGIKPEEQKVYVEIKNSMRDILKEMAALERQNQKSKVKSSKITTPK